MNPYSQFVSDYVSLTRKARAFPLGGFEPLTLPKVDASAPAALFFSPHPDDECISGGPALRLLREAGMRVINVAVTQGSNKARQAARWEELKQACQYIGFELLKTGENGLENINPKMRSQDPQQWSTNVNVIAKILADHQPSIILFPHEQDWNNTHIGTYYLVTDALGKLPAEFSCTCIETEFWGAMTDPNLMVEMSSRDVADMIAALTFHVGEVQRNPYHLSLPAWMADNVRRGTEVVGGQGGAAPNFDFAVLCRARKWANGKLSPLYPGGRILPASVNIGTFCS